jgi:DNA-binding MarR family transcriptional regulator
MQISDSKIREQGLTPPQFDIIATLGNTPGMSGRELGEKTLMTKGTLTGVLDRLEAKGLVMRTMNASDRRCMIVKLTPKGEAEFERVFAPQVEFCARSFEGYEEEDFAALDRELAKLKAKLDMAVATNAATDQCCNGQEQ